MILRWPIRPLGLLLNDPTLFLHFCDYLRFEEGLALYLNKLEFSSSKDNLYQVWLILACWFWRRRFFKIFCVFLLFRYYLPLERAYPLPLKTLGSSPSKDDLFQVWLKLAQWKIFFFKFSVYFYSFAIISPGKGLSPSFEQISIPFTQG
jgi:hypothetical protein